MKTIRMRWLMGTAWLLLAAGAGAAQTLPEILAKLPVDDSVAGNPLMARIVQMGPKAAGELCAMIQPPGKGDDVKARYALHGLVHYVARPGAEQERAAVESVLLQSLAAAQDVQVKTFFLDQLHVAGGSGSIATLGKLLTDEQLCEPAAQALLAIRAGVAESFRAALKNAKGKNLVTVIHALGVLRDKESAQAILAHAGSLDLPVRWAAEDALADIGDACAVDVLTLAADAKGVYRRSVTTANLLRLARRLADNGQAKAGAAIARNLLATRTDPQDGHVQAACLSLLADALQEGAMEDLLAAVQGKNVYTRQAAITLLERVPGRAVTGAINDKAMVAKGTLQTALIAILGNRGDKLGLPAVTAALTDDETPVRLAAAKAISRISPRDADSAITKMMKTPNSDEVATLKALLLELTDPDLPAEAARSLSTASVPGRAALLEVLAVRGGIEQAKAVFEAARDADSRVRLAAMAAASAVATPGDVPRILEWLSSKDSAERREAQAALGRICRRCPEALAAIREALPKADGEAHAAMLMALSRVGGAEAMKIVLADLSKENETLRDTTVRSLADWPDVAAAPELLKLTRDAKKELHHVLALRGYLRLASAGDCTPVQALAMYRDALAVCRTAEDKKAVLGALAGVRSVEALQMAGGCLDDPGVVEEAAAAAVRIACPANKKDPGLRGPAVAAVLQKVIELSKTTAFVKAAGDHLGVKTGAKAKAGSKGNVRPTVATPASSEHSENLAAESHNTPPEGFVALFNGKDLTGWKGLHGNPESRAKLTPAQAADAQKKADEEMCAHWSVQDGVLLFDGKGKALCTAKDYGDFEMYVDWKIGPRGDSGIYLRGSPQVQIWDNRLGSGGLYNNKKNPSNPTCVADNPVGQWNRFRIRMVGERVWVWLNGKAVVENVVMENYWNRSKPIYPTGQIELQNHSSPLWFRDIYIREIPRDKAASAPAPASQP